MKRVWEYLFPDDWEAPLGFTRRFLFLLVSVVMCGLFALAFVLIILLFFPSGQTSPANPPQYFFNN